MKKKSLEQRVELILEALTELMDNNPTLITREVAASIRSEHMIDMYLQMKNESDLNALENQSPEC